MYNINQMPTGTKTGGGAHTKDTVTTSLRVLQQKAAAHNEAAAILYPEATEAVLKQSWQHQNNP
jgi:hypothetical protein